MPSLLARLSTFSARHRVLVIAVWLVILGLFTTVLAAGGSADSKSGSSIPSTQAAQTLQKVHAAFPAQSGSGSPDTLKLVMSVPGGQTVTSAASASAVGRLVATVSSQPHVKTVSNPLDPKMAYVSADQTTAVATISFAGLSDSDRPIVYDRVVKAATQAPAPLHVEVGGQIAPDQTPVAGPGEAVGVLVAFVVLFLTFGSMLVAGANMLVAFLGVGIGSLGILAVGTITPVQPTTLTLATMLGLAVGIDYSLFILTRFRSELREGRSVHEAIGRAAGTAGTAVVFAGLTVIIALVALALVQIDFITEMGFAGAFGVLVAVLMSLTLLPVLMRTIGRRVLPRKERRTQRDIESAVDAFGDDVSQVAVPPARRRFLQHWIDLILRRPVLAIVGAVATVLIVAVPMLSMQTASSLPGGNDPHATQRAAYNQIVAKFGGVQSPLVVLVSGDRSEEQQPAVVQALKEMSDVQAVQQGPIAASGKAALVTVIPRGGPIDASTKQLVDDIRTKADSVAGVHLEVTGETAIGIDGDAAQNTALVKYVIVIAVLAFLLLMLLFRSVLVPLAATLGFLLSVGASFGASVAVFQWGWLDPIIPAPQGDPMISLLPIILVGVLFGLAMDYQVFLVSRIHEMHHKGFSSNEAIRRGFDKSAPVLVAAAAIMTVVFCGFASSPMAVGASIAFGLAVGVVVDAFFVRMIITPAVLSLMGRSAWWIPAWLNKVLPVIDVEGRSLEVKSEASVLPELTPADAG